MTLKKHIVRLCQKQASCYCLESRCAGSGVTGTIQTPNLLPVRWSHLAGLGVGRVVNSHHVKGNRSSPTGHQACGRLLGEPVWGQPWKDKLGGLEMPERQTGCKAMFLCPSFFLQIFTEHCSAPGTACVCLPGTLGHLADRWVDDE